jgi:probable HAF family extracellular repeat protein
LTRLFGKRLPEQIFGSFTREAAMRLSIHPVAILTTILLPITTLAAPIYSFTDLGALSAGDPPKLYINDSGQVAGTYRPSAAGHSQAFLWDPVTGRHNIGVAGESVPGSSYSVATAINNAGQVAGFSSTVIGGNDTGRQAFRWQNGTLTGLGVSGPNFNTSSVTDMNSLGQVTGYVGNMFPPFRQEAMISEGNTLRGSGPGTGPIALGRPMGVSINDSGIVAGNSEYYDESIPRNRSHAFVWDGQTMTGLESLMSDGNTTAVGINNAGRIAGTSDIALVSDLFQYGPMAVIWENGQAIELGSLFGYNSDGIGGSLATALNERGQVIGNSGSYYVGGHSFIWENAVMIDLGVLSKNYAGRSYSSPHALNENGQVVGREEVFDESTIFSMPHAWLWDDGELFDLNDLANIPDDFLLTDAQDINENGWIVGTSAREDGSVYGWLLTPLAAVPAPSSGLLILGGIALLAVGRNNKVSLLRGGS